jgi:hypothetical protein
VFSEPTLSNAIRTDQDGAQSESLTIALRDVIGIRILRVFDADADV